MRSRASSVRFKSLMSTMAPAMRSISPQELRVTVPFSPIQRSAPSPKHHPVFAAVGRLLRGGGERRAAAAGDVFGVNPRQQVVEIVQRGGGREPQ